MGKVKERVAEWETNGWVKPVKGMKNTWNNPLVAMPKVSEGRTDKNDIRLCVDACPGNSAVMGPEYNLPKITEMFSSLKKMKKKMKKKKVSLVKAPFTWKKK